MLNKFFRFANYTVVYRKWSNVSSSRERSHYFALRRLPCCCAHYVGIHYSNSTRTPKYRKVKFVAASPSCLRHLLVSAVLCFFFLLILLSRISYFPSIFYLLCSKYSKHWFRSFLLFFKIFLFIIKTSWFLTTIFVYISTKHI